MTAIALFGAGGKMGYRLASNLKGSRFSGPACRGVRRRQGATEEAVLALTCVPADAALEGAEVVILAVPDTHIGKVAAGISEQAAGGDDGCRA